MIENELEKWVSEFHPTVEKEVLEVLSKALANKFVHHPSQALNKAKGEEHELLTKTLKKIYPLKD